MRDGWYRWTNGIAWGFDSADGNPATVREVKCAGHHFLQAVPMAFFEFASRNPFLDEDQNRWPGIGSNFRGGERARTGSFDDGCNVRRRVAMTNAIVADRRCHDVRMAH